jgi:hypothetical protein
VCVGNITARGLYQGMEKLKKYWQNLLKILPYPGQESVQEIT